VDAEPWNLLHDGIVVAIARTAVAGEVCLHVRARHLRAEPFVVRLAEVTTLAYVPYDGSLDAPDVVDPQAIVAAAPNLAEAVIEPDGLLVVAGSLGSLRLRYGALSLDGIALDTLRGLVRDYWARWRAQWAMDAHPLVRDCITRRPWNRTLLPALLEAWRTERTSDLADTIEILDACTRGSPPCALDLADLATLARWPASWSSDPGAALAELARIARSTWDLAPDAHVDERHRLGGLVWSAIARALSATLATEPDPRVGRAVIEMLRTPSDHWFRVDQVGHVAGPFAPPDDAPSFADHALVLLARHADAGSAARIEHQARVILIEADCNGAEMAARLSALAGRLRERFPADRTLAESAKTALRNRAVA